MKNYWELHKEIWTKLFDELPLAVCRVVTELPHSWEGRQFQDSVKSAVEKEIEEEKQVSEG